MADLGIAVFGDVVDSRLDGAAATRWLRDLATELDSAYGPRRRAPFGFTQGDELQGLLEPDADPLEAVFRATLRERRVPAMRWVIAAGDIDPGEGPATQRTGAAFLVARELTDLARRRRDRLLVRSGDEAIDARLDDLAPVLGNLLAGLTERQRTIARMLVVDGLRQADVAEGLGIARATVSVAADRAGVRDIERLGRVVLDLLREGMRTAA